MLILCSALFLVAGNVACVHHFKNKWWKSGTNDEVGKSAWSFFLALQKNTELHPASDRIGSGYICLHCSRFSCAYLSSILTKIMCFKVYLLIFFAQRAADPVLSAQFEPSVTTVKCWLTYFYWRKTRWMLEFIVIVTKAICGQPLQKSCKATSFHSRLSRLQVIWHSITQHSTHSTHSTS